MGVEFGGKPCCAPEQEIANCRTLAAEGLTVRLDPWAGRANSFRCPVGPTPGQGWILLLRRDLDALGLDTPRDLEFSFDHEGRSVILRNLYPVRAGAVLPGLRGDPDGVWWVELADCRRVAKASVVDAAYNVASTYAAAATYFSATLNSGSPWTWSEMVEDLWTAVGASLLGTYPGLPFTPDGTPENWTFYGACAYDALNEVLARIGCVLALDPVADTFSIVQVSEDDTASDSALSQYDTERTWDAEWLQSLATTRPATLRVRFPKHRATADTTGASPWYTVDVTDPESTPSGVVAGTTVQVEDDLPAQYDTSGTLTNTSDLATRAAERAEDYFRRARQERRHRAYTGLLSEVGILPGAQVQATLWEDRGAGLVTSLVSVDGLPLPGRPLGTAEGGVDVGFGSAARVIESTQDAWDTTLPSLDSYELARDYTEIVYRLQAQGLVGASIGTVEAVDGNPSYTSTTTLRFDESDGFSLSQPATGVVRVDLLAATTTQAGIVSTAAQEWTGVKTFDNAAIFTEHVNFTGRSHVALNADSAGYDHASAHMLSFLPNADRTIHSLLATAAAEGYRIVIQNVSDTYTITLPHDSGSASGQPFNFPGGADRVLGYFDSIELEYDHTDGVWYEICGQAQMHMADILSFAAAHG